VNEHNRVKLTFGDADTQQTSPMSKRRRLVTDSIDCLADLREQPSSTISSSQDKTPRKFKLLFGGSSEELSQPLTPRDGDHGDDVENTKSDATSDSQLKPGSSTDSSQSEYERGKDEDVMTQADEEAMKTYVPLNAGALSYISDNEDNILDFFLKPPSNRSGTSNCQTAKVTSSLHPSVVDDAVIGGGNRAKNSSVVSKASSVTNIQCSDTGKEVDASMLFIQEPSAVISELIDDDRSLTATASAGVAAKSTAFNGDTIRGVNKDDCLASKVTVSAAVTTAAGGIQDARLPVCQAQLYSQGSDDFQTAASQNSTLHSVIVVNGDVTSRSAGSQPLDSDSTIDVGCSPVKNQFCPAGTSPTRFASDATTTDGWCTPCKSSFPDVTGSRSPYRQRTDVRSCTSQLPVFDDQSRDSPRSPCLKLTNTSSSTSQPHVPANAQCMFFKSSVPAADSPQSPRLKFADMHSSAGLLVNVQVVQLCRDVSSSTSNNTDASHQVVADCYDADVDSDSDDVVSLCVGVRRRRSTRQRLRSRSTSADTVVVSSDSDQSLLLQRSRDQSKDGVGRVDVTTVSSGSESDDRVQAECSEADCLRGFMNNASTVERSPILFSESST